jgi:hypothetical protein
MHNVHGSAILLRMDAEAPPVDMSGLMVVLRSDAFQVYKGPTLSRGQIGKTVEELKVEWKKWNRHVNAVVVTAYNEESDESAVMLGILYPARYKGIFKGDRYQIIDFGED